MDISIAMATYNGESFIAEQLRSLAQQTLKPSELVVTDDGSTDKTLAILETFAENAPFAVSIVRNDSPLGFAANFLKAAYLCQSRYIAFCDQDDSWLPNKLSVCAGHFRDPDVSLVVHSGLVVNESLQTTSWHFPKIGSTEIRDPLCVDPWFGASGFAMVFRTPLPLMFSSQNPPWEVLQPQNLMAHDGWTWFLASVFGKIAFVKDSLVMYRRHRGNATNPRKISSANLLKASMNSSKEAYIARAGIAAARATLLCGGLDTLPAPQAIRARAGIVYYRQLEVLLLQRAEIYDGSSSALTREIRVLDLASQGGYRSRDRGGFGLSSFIKDAVAGLKPRMSNP